LPVKSLLLSAFRGRVPLLSWLLRILHVERIAPTGRPK
jgi:hypothetical protein